MPRRLRQALRAASLPLASFVFRSTVHAGCPLKALILPSADHPSSSSHASILISLPPSAMERAAPSGQEGPRI